MKILTYILIGILLMSVPLASAQEELEIAEAAAPDSVFATEGVAPDSVFYGLDKALDQIGLILTRDKSKKAEKGLKIAQERLQEARSMAENNKLEHALKAQEQHQKALEKVEAAIDELETDNDLEKIKEELSNIVRVQNQVESHYQKVTEVKDTILERQRERMTAEQIAKLEEVFDKIKEKAKLTELKTTEKKTKTKVKYKGLTGLSSEEIEGEVEKIEVEQGLAKGRAERAVKERQNAKASLEQLRNKIVIHKKAGIDIAGIQTMIAEAEEKLESSKGIGHIEARNIAEEVKDFGNEVSKIAQQLSIAKQGGNFEGVKAQLQEVIKNRQQIHMQEIKEIQERHNISKQDRITVPIGDGPSRNN